VRLAAPAAAEQTREDAQGSMKESGVGNVNRDARLPTNKGWQLFPASGVLLARTSYRSSANNCACGHVHVSDVCTTEAMRMI
jgi:hypothetical protein